MSSPEEDPFALALSPQGLLYLQHSQEQTMPKDIRLAFEKHIGSGLMHLGLYETSKTLIPNLSYWRDFSQMYFSALCSFPGLTDSEAKQKILLPPPITELAKFALRAPPIQGGEYINETILSKIWDELHSFFFKEISSFRGSIQKFFDTIDSKWNLLGRVCFHLVENKANEQAPFAFLATYAPRISKDGKIQYRPLNKALEEYSTEANKAQLLQLLIPVQKASEKSNFLKQLMESNEIFHPLAWSPSEAYQFLKDIPIFEAAGVRVRVPDWWHAKRPPRPQINLTIGGKNPSIIGLDSMLKFSIHLSLQDEELREDELDQILSSTSGMVLLRGKWVEVDGEKLTEALAHWKKIAKETANGEMTFIEGMRLLSGVNSFNSKSSSLEVLPEEWMRVSASPEFTQIINQLKDPEKNLDLHADSGTELQASLRPYQKVGVKWLLFLNRLGIGGCLADDMGLGKTIQIIAFLLLIKRDLKIEKLENSVPSLLIIPASLLGNWQSEIDRFAPTLCYQIRHPSRVVEKKENGVYDLVITTYGFLQRDESLVSKKWNCIILDEAQAIKNSGTKQTRTVKSLKGRLRLALTGTPIENRLSDLWSLFDFICPGLLGPAKTFSNYIKTAEKTHGENQYSALRELVQPYFLRRLKTDKSIISDLPDKTEYNAYCSLSKKQVALYQASVEELTKKIETAEGIQRRGLVLSYLIRFKQICNHPSQWLGDSQYEPTESGKFTRLRELCEEIASKQEKVLIFTQYKSIIDQLSHFLEGLFGRQGLVLHGETAVKKRKELVDLFQDPQGPPFFVLSLKAGGTGLNLTAANHIIHFDRWWNPAVENQATDRAFRIGQKKNVLVHKFICQGTIEEKVDALISSKQNLSNEILEFSGEAILTELSNTELIKIVSLDLQKAIDQSY